MVPEPLIAPHFAALDPAVTEAIARRYPESGAQQFGITAEGFAQVVATVLIRYAADGPAEEQLQLVATLRVEELVLARACSAGHERAWEVFLTRYRSALYETAYRMASDEATARELADELYADLYGVERKSKLDSYMGRGSLEGWLRTVLAQRCVDRWRGYAKTVSLEERVEAGESFTAPVEAASSQPDPRVGAAVRQALSELKSDDRYILAAYYLDQRTLAEIARTIGVHESTISRRLERLTANLRKRVRKCLQRAGLGAYQCDEILEDLDVRDLNIDVAAQLRQEPATKSFYNKDQT
jgi:RNA polymerase sigma-70 factor (ECF subfamily)